MKKWKNTGSAQLWHSAKLKLKNWIQVPFLFWWSPRESCRLQNCAPPGQLFPHFSHPPTSPQTASVKMKTFEFRSKWKLLLTTIKLFWPLKTTIFGDFCHQILRHNLGICYRNKEIIWKSISKSYTIGEFLPPNQDIIWEFVTLLLRLSAAAAAVLALVWGFLGGGHNLSMISLILEKLLKISWKSNTFKKLAHI